MGEWVGACVRGWIDRGGWIVLGLGFGRGLGGYLLWYVSHLGAAERGDRHGEGSEAPRHMVLSVE